MNGHRGGAGNRVAGTEPGLQANWHFSLLCFNAYQIDYCVFLEKVMADVFISYSRADRKKAEQIKECIEAQSLTVWMDTRLEAGEIWDETIERELSNAKCVMVLWSNHSVISRWVRTEATYALERGILLPILIDNVAPPLAFKLVQADDLSGWNGNCGQLKKTLKRVDAIISGKIDVHEHKKT